METLIITLIISLTACAISCHFYNYLSADNRDSCGCGGACGGCSGNCDQHDIEQTTTDTPEKNRETPPVKPAQILAV